MNKAVFFRHIRHEPFSGKMTQSQVSGTDTLLDAGAHLDLRWLAYILATVFHETGARMQPVREGFATSDAHARRILKKYPYAQPDPATGQAYYGRGHVQLTWAKNYQAMGEATGVDLYVNPDLALDPDISIQILFLGMIDGLYTGRKLADYFNAGRTDPVGARRIVNGTDRAALIAGYYHAFHAALQAAHSNAPEELNEAERETDAPQYPDPKPLTKSRTMQAQGVTGVGTVGATTTEMVSDTLTQAQDAAGQLAFYLDIAKWLFIALIIAGIAWTVYSRWDDSRKRKR